MNKILMKLSLLLAVALTATGFASCSDSDDNKTHTPTVTVGQALAGTTMVGIDYTVADATAAVYKVQ